jgi:Lon protease-like protein
MADRLPLFPLGTVLVPGEVLPLHVFEPRYRTLVSDLVSAHARDQTPPRFGVIAIRAGQEVGPERLGGLYDVGCAAEVLEITEHEDGSSELVTVGRHRFRLDGVDAGAGTPYLTGSVEWLEEPVTPVDGALVDRVRATFARYCELLGVGPTDLADPQATAASTTALADPTLLSYVVTGTMLLDLPERQRLLASADAAERLRRAAGLLRRELLLWNVVPSVPALELTRVPPDPR